MPDNSASSKGPSVVAVCISPGGIPKLPQPRVQVTRSGMVGDGRDHDKHNKSTRAISLFDEEIIEQLRGEGFDLVPGSIGENITLRKVDVQRRSPGTVLQLGQVRVRLEAPRKPCFVLDAIDPALQKTIAGRCGYLAAVITEGELKPGDSVVCIEPRACETGS